MERPINVFFDILQNLKDLIVNVKIGNAKFSLLGKIVAQISPTTFEVKDPVGNKGVCTLVDKEANDLDKNEMSVKGYVDETMSFTFIQKIVYNMVEDFKGVCYSWTTDNDSTTSVVVLQYKEA
jgi:hypothetical protein